MWDKPCKKPMSPHGACNIEREKCEVMRDLENIKSRIISELERYKCHVVSEMMGLDGETQRKITEIIARYEAITKKISEELCDLDATSKAYFENAEDTLERFKRQMYIVNTLSLEMLAFKRHVEETMALERAAHKQDILTLTEKHTQDILQLREAYSSIMNNNLPADVVNAAVAEAVSDYVASYGGGFATSDELNNVSDRITEIHKNGVYKYPVKFRPFMGNTSFVSGKFAIPHGGFSVRYLIDRDIIVDNETRTMVYAVRFYLPDGTYDEENTLKYTGNAVTSRFLYIPYIKDRYVEITVAFKIGDEYSGDSVSDIGALQIAVHLQSLVVFTGEVEKGHGFIGTTPATIKTNDADEEFGFLWNLNTYSWKYGCLTSVLPLRYVSGVCVSPDMWVVAKVYTYDPATKTHVWKDSRNFYSRNPVFGSECSIDFSDCDENDYAIVGVGRVPFYYEYDAVTRDGETFGTANQGMFGLNRTEIDDKVHVKWKNNMDVVNCMAGTSLPVTQNLNLLKSISHKTVTALFGCENDSPYKYLYAKDDFSGVFYGGEYIGGAFYYNVSPVAYYTALLNPNSNAYGDSVVEDTGFRYGIKCSSFASLLHGHPIPRTTFDYRYNKISGFELAPFDFTHEIGTLKKYDVICQGAGRTGHCVMVTDIINIGNEVTVLKVVESTTPATGENIFVLTNAVPYVRSAPEDYYSSAYGFVARFDPKCDRSIVTKADWTMPYTTPQKVMSARGFGGIYLLDKHKVVVSVDKDVAKLIVYKDLEPYGEYFVRDLAPEEKNFYNVVTLPLTDEGEYTIYNDVDSGYEKIGVVDASMFEVFCSHNADTDEVSVYTSHNARVKYLDFIYECLDGENKGETTTMCYEPTFVNGVFTIPATIETSIGTWRVRLDNLGNNVNVMFTTEYDTNTFWVDGEGDRGL